MKYPNEIQVCLLFDRKVKILDSIAKTFGAFEQKSGFASYRVSESRDGVFHRLFGADDLMVTLEYIDRPANVDVFRQALESPFTKIAFPEAAYHLARHETHILLNVSHGVLGGSEELARLMATLEMPMEGASLPKFKRRLDVAAMLAHIANTQVMASVVHWTQSNQLLAGKQFEGLSRMATPSPMHIHPFLFGGGQSPDGKTLAGIRTFGARHFIGAELLIEPSPLPWTANFETMLAFLRVCLTKDGYVIPDGDSFGPEDRSQSYRVHHRGAKPGDVPVYELEPLMYREYGFQAESYVPPERVFDDRSPPADLMPADPVAREELTTEWRNKRAMTEGIGGHFEVRARAAPPAKPKSFFQRLTGLGGKD
jgi:hypothetical protein